MCEIPTYTDEMGEVLYDPPQVVKIAGRPRSHIARGYPGLVAIYAWEDHVNQQIRDRRAERNAEHEERMATREAKVA